VRHKRFNEVYPYTYYLKHKTTGQKYHGVRWGNLRLGLSPSNDFGKVYFTSGKLRESFKNSLEDYVFCVKWTFDTIEEARNYEDKINTKLMYRDDWEIWNNSKAIYNKISPSLGRKVKGTEIADKIGKANKGKIRTEDFKLRQSIIQREKVKTRKHYFCSSKHSKMTSDRMKKNNPSIKGLTEEHKKRIGDSQRGVPKPKMTEEHKKNLSKALKGNVPWNKGKKHSAETRKKMSENSGGTKHLIGKKVCCTCCMREWDLGNYSKHIKAK